MLAFGSNSIGYRMLSLCHRAPSLLSVIEANLGKGIQRHYHEPYETVSKVMGLEPSLFEHCYKVYRQRPAYPPSLFCLLGIRIFKVISRLGFLFLRHLVMTILESQPVLLQSTDNAPVIFFDFIVVDPFLFNRPTFNFCNNLNNVPGLWCTHINVVVIGLGEDPVR